MTGPVRKLIKPTTPRTVHILNLSGALAAPVQAEATTEADFVRLAALCPTVVRIDSQPETFDLAGARFTPDYRIECLGGCVSYWEVKLEARISKYRTTFDAVAEKLTSAGVRFFAVSDASIRRHSAHQVAQLIHRYAKVEASKDATDKVLADALLHPRGITFKELRRCTSAPEELIFHLLARRHLTFKTRIGIRADDQVIHPKFLGCTDELLLASWLGVSPWRANA